VIVECIILDLVIIPASVRADISSDRFLGVAEIDILREQVNTVE
jgi:hypothetical protein